MRTLRSTLTAITLVVAVAAPAWSQDDEVTALTSGREVSGNLPTNGRPYRTFTVEVPEGARRLEVVLAGQLDVDLFVKEGGPILESWSQEATVKGDSPGKRERVALSTDGDPPLRAGTYYVDVVHGEGDEGKPTTFTLTATVITTGPGPGAQPPGAGPPIDLELPSFSGDFTGQVTLDGERPFRTFLMQVAPNVSDVRLSLSGAAGDCDIYVRHAEPMASWDQADARANGPEADEVLHLRRASLPRLRSGTYYVDIARAVNTPVTLTVTATYTLGFSGPEAAGARPGPSTEQNVEGEIREESLFTVELPGDSPDYRTYVIYVPKGAQSLLVTASGADKDVDLFLRHGKPIENYRNDPDHRANAARLDEQLYVDVGSEPPLRPGKYYLDIARAVTEEPIAPFEVAVRFDAQRPPPIPATTGPIEAIAFGQRVLVQLERDERKAARFSFQVPAAAKRLHVSVLGATRDIDLFLRQGEVITDYDESTGYDWKAVSSRLNERLTIDAASAPTLRAGTYYLDVASLVSSDVHIRFTLLITLDDPPQLKSDDMRLPPFARPTPLTPLERVLQATVQIEGEHGAGSGTCITPSGLIITNHHVLEHEGKLQEKDVYVSFPDAWDEPPEQVFVARVVAYDAALDLVLLQLEKDIYDRDVSAIELPWVPVGDASRVRLGDVLLIAGYPGIGGDESRSSISVSRGIVAGFNTDGQRRTWLKTDATINSGNSGGSAYWQDEQGAYHYVGVPTHKLYEEGGALGFCRPTSCLPGEWVKQVEAELARQR